jgi:hypothetical protein
MNLEQFGVLMTELVNDPIIKKIEVKGWSEPKLLIDKPILIMRRAESKKRYKKGSVIYVLTKHGSFVDESEYGMPQQKKYHE